MSGPTESIDQPRRHSIRTVHMIRIMRFPIKILAILKHIIAILYYVTTIFLYLIAKPYDLRAASAYSPKIVIGTMVCFALLHCFGLFGTFRQISNRILPWNTNIFTTKKHPKWISFNLTILHILDVACQSYQAIQVSSSLVNPLTSFAFSFFVSLNCIITPWFLFTKHQVARKAMVISLNSFFGSFISTGFPLLLLLSNAIRYMLLEKVVTNDMKFVTETLLFAKYAVVTSPLDLTTKCFLQLSSYFALRRFFSSMYSNEMEPAIQRLQHQKSTWLQVAPSFRFDFTEQRRLVVYLVLNVSWGIILLIGTVLSTWFRASCPSNCINYVSPVFDLSCRCVYIRINCGQLGILGEQIEPLLHADIVGTSLFNLEIQRCALPHGISTNTLANFTSLYGLSIFDCKMVDWEFDSNQRLPSSLTVFHIRSSHLSTVPSILTKTMPNLIFLRLDDNDITEIPDSVFTAWASLSSLAILNTKLSRISMEIPKMSHLEWLELRGNSIQEVSLPWQQLVRIQLVNMHYLDLSANNITKGPWSLINPSAILELSSNPIDTVPDSLDMNLIATRALILDDTKFCNKNSAPGCQTKCTRLCQTRLLKNFRCDPVCNNEQCQYDGGDCASIYS